MNQNKVQIPYHTPFLLNEHDTSRLTSTIKEIIVSGNLTNGIYVRKLEEKIRTYYNVEYCIATSSCSQALLLCLKYAKQYIKTAETTAFNWWSDLYILNILNIPIFWDNINYITWLPLEREYTTDNLSLYLHTFGNVGKSHLSDLAIYDASHCLGAKFEDIGLATCISLAPTKLVTAGEGGIILTNDKQLYLDVIEHRDRLSRMPEINAVIGLEYFKHLEEILEWKKKVYLYYKKHLYGQFQEFNEGSSYNTIGFINTHQLQIPSHIQYKQYYHPVHRGLPTTEYIYKNIICLPSYYNCNYQEIVKDILEFNGLGDV